MILSKTPLSCALALPFALATAACGDRSLEDDPERDPEAPSLQIQSPPRGSVLGSHSVTLEGIAADSGSGLAEVTVNGARASVDGRGHFTVDVSVEPGITLLKTRAVDEAGNEVTDTRAVLAGDLAPSDRPVREAITARLNDETLAVLGKMGAQALEGTDLASYADGFNPVVDTGGDCLGAVVDVVDIEKGAVEVDLRPGAGALAVNTRIEDLFVEMETDYRAACVGGSAGIELRADALEMTARIPIRLEEDGRLTVSLEDVDGAFEGFELKVGAIPSSVLELFVSDLDQKVIDAMVGPMEDLLPSLASDFLAAFFSDDWVVNLFGREVAISLVPRVFELTPAGGTIVLDLGVQVVGAPEMGYLSTPLAPPAAAGLTGDRGFGVAVADDALNQALASFWAAGATNLEADVGEDDEGLLGGSIDRLELYLLLPPVANASAGSGKVRLTIGDLLLDAIEVRGGEPHTVARAAVSAVVDIGARVDDAGRVRLSTSAPELSVDILSEGVEGANVLDRASVETLASVAVARVLGVVDDSLGAVPIPTFLGTRVTAPSFEAMAGYALIAGTLERVEE